MSGMQLSNHLPLSVVMIMLLGLAICSRKDIAVQLLPLLPQSLSLDLPATHIAMAARQFLPSNDECVWDYDIVGRWC